MSALTIRLPDDTTQRLKTLAQSQGLSVNKLVEEMSAQAIAVFDVEMRFKTLAAGADREKALVILDRLPWSVMWRSEEHTSELQSLMRISYAVFCLKKKHIQTDNTF